MMKAIGKALAALLMMAVLLASTAVRAAVTASLDRDRVVMGDTMRLTITATENEQIDSTDLRPLLTDFEILQRSTSSNTSIVNGRRSHTSQLLIDIMPRREGTLKIPPLRVGQGVTNMLLVSVGPAPTDSSGGDTVLFDAEVDRDSVYVQGQVILTLRVQQAINLDGRSITELELDNAFIKPLEQKSFQRTIEGRPWLVHEVRYAIFPEQSGTLEIPAQTFSGRESKPRRSFFDLNSGGRQLRRRTQALNIEVLPRPDTFPADTWLPARKLTLEESWSTPPEQLRAGESATRTIRMQGEGLQGAQLPPILFPATEGLKYYPDQPVINDTETPGGLLGVRQDSAALVPTRAGNWSIPEIRIPWWDTESGELRHAVLPGREITVAAADPTMTAPLTPMPVAVIDSGEIALTPGATAAPGSPIWQLVAAISSLGWLLTLAYFLWLRRGSHGSATASHEDPSERRAFKHLLSACASGDTVRARQAMIDWAAALFPRAAIISLSQAAAEFDDTALYEQLDALNNALYSRSGGAWQGATLAEAATRLRKHQRKAESNKDLQLQLYPAAAI